MHGSFAEVSEKIGNLAREKLMGKSTLRERFLADYCRLTRDFFKFSDLL